VILKADACSSPVENNGSNNGQNGDFRVSAALLARMGLASVAASQVPTRVMAHFFRF